MVLGLDKGVLRKWKPSKEERVVTAQRYVDKQGRKRYVGTSKLQATEKLGLSLL